MNAPWFYTLFKRSEMPEEINIRRSIIFFALAYGIINAYSSGMALYRKLTFYNPKRGETIMNTPDQITPCPYCGDETSFELPGNYAPVFVHCTICNKKFIIERLSKGFQTFTVEDAPASSDPDCIEIEDGSSDEQ